MKQISNPNLKTQAEILKKFIVLSTYGEEINNLVRVIRPSTSGMGKNRLEANNIIVKLKEVLTSLRNKKSLIKGAEQLIGEIKLSSKTGIEKINPTTFTGAGLNIIKQSNDLFNRFFKINKIHADLLQAISENKGGPLSFSAKEQENALKFIKSYLFSANLSMYRGKSITEIRNELLFGENTLAHRWSNFKQSNPDHWLGKRIFPKISPSQVKPNRIEYKAAIIDSSGDIRNITELTEMLLSDDVTIKQLAEDTINYAYLTGGIQDAVSLVKFININYLNMYGFGNNIHDLSKQVDINILEEQFYQNYPQYTNSVDIFGIEKKITK